MHEFSIASSLLDLAKQHTPAGAVLRRIVMEAGPLHGIDREAMQWAWRGRDGRLAVGGRVEHRNPVPAVAYCAVRTAAKSTPAARSAMIASAGAMRAIRLAEASCGC